MNSLEQIEVTIKDAEKKMEMRDLCLKLQKNTLFKKVIAEAYFKDEAVRLVHAKSAPHTQAEDIQKEIEIGIQSIGTFRQFLNFLVLQGDQAEKAIEDHRETRQEIIEEGED